jgi:hypothetical protein
LNFTRSLSGANGGAFSVLGFGGWAADIPTRPSKLRPQIQTEDLSGAIFHPLQKARLGDSIKLSISRAHFSRIKEQRENGSLSGQGQRRVKALHGIRGIFLTLLQKSAL